jgi:hypothetical protein
MQHRQHRQHLLHLLHLLHHPHHLRRQHRLLFIRYSVCRLSLAYHRHRGHLGRLQRHQARLQLLTPRYGAQVGHEAVQARPNGARSSSALMDPSVSVDHSVLKVHLEKKALLVLPGHSAVEDGVVIGAEEVAAEATAHPEDHGHLHREVSLATHRVHGLKMHRSRALNHISHLPDLSPPPNIRP